MSISPSKSSNDIARLKQVLKEKARRMIGKNGLQIEEIVTHLKGSTEADALEQVPDGPKENLFFMVDNQKNVERRSKGKQSEYFDDCGVWISKTTCTMKTVLLLDDSNKLLIVCI